MKFRGRKQYRIGPVFLNFGNRGKSWFKSWGIKVWRYTYNATHRTSTFDTPGPGAVYHQHGKRGER